MEGNRDLLATMQALLCANVAHREQGRAWGEVKLLMQWKDGSLVDFRFVEETICRNKKLAKPP